MGYPVWLNNMLGTRELGELTTPQTTVLADAITDDDGRVTALGPNQVPPGTYQLRFDTAAYYAVTGQECFYPEVIVTFAVTDQRHHHVPLLLSPFAYSTYRGS